MSMPHRATVSSALLLALTLLSPACSSDEKPPLVPRVSERSAPYALGHLYVLNDGGPAGKNSVSIYGLNTSNPVERIKKGIYDPKALAFDGAGRLYVANNFTNQVSIYPLGRHAPGRYDIGIYYPKALAIDQRSDVAVLAEGQVDIFGPRGALLSKVTDSSTYAFSPSSIAYDPSGNLWVKWGRPGNVNYIAAVHPGSSILTGTMTSNIGAGPLAVDGSGNLYTANSGNDIAVYPPGANTPSRIIHYGDWVDLMKFDRSGNLFVATYQSISAFNPNTGTLLYTISKGVRVPTDMAFDAANNLYVSDRSLGGVTVFAPNTGAPLLTIHRGINQPVAVGIGP